MLHNQTSFYHLKDKQFYSVDRFYGDPQGALEAGFNDIMPDDFLHAIVINENGKKVKYALKNKRTVAWKKHSYFWDFFITRDNVTKLLNKKLKKIKKDLLI